jgi:uncharacterized protein YdaU (DUF1376 family)
VNIPAVPAPVSDGIEQIAGIKHAKTLAAMREETLTTLKRTLGQSGYLLMWVGAWYNERALPPDKASRQLGRTTGLTREEVLFVIHQHWSRVHPRHPWL